MKIVLTGATGFLGSEVLEQCCCSTSIDTVIVLTRRSLQGEGKHAKIRQVIVQDFRCYTPEVLETISDADACIWCLGGTEPSIEVDYPRTFVEAVTKSHGPQSKNFTYVHCSGVLAERDQTEPLWFLQDGRRAKGAAETLLLDVANDPIRQNHWRTFIMRPSMILPKQPSIFQSLLSLVLGSVRVDDLANASIKLALNGVTSGTLENEDLVQLGKV